MDTVLKASTQRARVHVEGRPSRAVTSSESSGEPTWEQLVAPDEALLGERLAPRAGERLLELGCDDGVPLARLAARAPGPVLAVGVDVSRARLERGREAHPGMQFVRAEPAAFLAASREGWDIITARFALAFLGWPRLASLAAEKLRAGGRLGLATSLADTLFEARSVMGEMAAGAGLRPPEVPLPLTQSDLASTLEEAGLCGIEVEARRHTLHFATGLQAVQFLVASGFASHPWLGLLDPASHEALQAEFAERLERFATAQGVPLTLSLAVAVARKP